LEGKKMKLNNNEISKLNKIDLHNNLKELAEVYEIEFSKVLKLKESYSLEVLTNKLERNYWNNQN